MANPILRKAFNAGGAIGPNLAVKFSASGTVVLASAGADPVIGISVPAVSAALGDRVDVVLVGIADCLAGAAAAITRGDLLMADANGALVTASGSVRIVGTALESAVPGDIFPVLLD